MRWKRFALVASVLALVVSPMTPAQLGGQTPAQNGGTAQVDDVDLAGFFTYSGGPVRAKVARTNTSLSAYPEGGWINVPGATLARIVAAGTTDLMNLAFSAECQVRSLGGNDTARIRILHFINGVAVAPVEPYDGDQRFCSSVNPPATHKGNWVRRVGGGNHVFQVQIQTVDFPADNGAIASTLDDWTFELVVYD